MMLLPHRIPRLALLPLIIATLAATPVWGDSLSDHLLQRAEWQLETARTQYSALMVKVELRQRLFNGTRCELSVTPAGTFRVDDWNTGFLGLFRDRGLETELKDIYARIEAVDPESPSAASALSLLPVRVGVALARYKRQALIAQGLITGLLILPVIIAAVLIVRRQKRRTRAVIAALAGPPPSQTSPL